MPNLIETLEKCTQADLDEIDSAIAAMEKKLATLKEAQKLLRNKLGVTIAKSETADKRVSTRAMRKLIAEFMATTPGQPLRKADLVRTFKLEDGEFEHLIKSELFMQTPDGSWKLTYAGLLLAKKAA